MSLNMLTVDERIERSMKDLLEQALEQGDLPTRSQLEVYYDRFAGRFGPDRLASLDGEALLNTMHAHGDKESLVYWLEFKDDEEFPAVFGGIGGGSALKFGLYKRKESGVWMTGNPRKQTELTLAQAIDLARRHRDHLVAGAELLGALPVDGTDEDYAGLQRELTERAASISNTAWGHKYLSLLYPDKLDDYHAEEYQRFHLVKLLQTPPKAVGRFVTGGRYVKIARELGVPINHLTNVLNRLHGKPYRIWRIGTSLGAKESIWSHMRNGSFVAIGWNRLGDLSQLSHNQESKDALRDMMRVKYPKSAPNVASRKAGEIFNFVNAIADGDLVLPSDGQRVLGIGRVTGDYEHQTTPHAGAPHHRPVKWLSLEGWKLPQAEGLRTAVDRVRRDPYNLVAIERHVLDVPLIPDSEGSKELDGIPGRVQAILARKGQVILYGPPGTGKTFWARQAALDLVALGAFGKRYSELDPVEQTTVNGDGVREGLLRACTFHPAYGYEDFLEGYRPHENSSGQLVFERRDGVFRRLCADAALQPERKFFLLIDEINRGDIARIFGELLTLLEKDKRGENSAVHLPLSGDRFWIPDNVFLIGTMNTADRSIALLDTALRRRFGFIELMPDYSLLTDAVVGESIPLGLWLSAVNDRIRTHLGHDARNQQIGHAYLIENGRPVADFAHFSRILAEDILPLLEEYCYEDYASLALILGQGLVDEGRQRIRGELFDSGRRDDLIQALLAPNPDIATSPQVVTLDEIADEPEDAESDEEASG